MAFVRRQREKPECKRHKNQNVMDEQWISIPHTLYVTSPRWQAQRRKQKSNRNKCKQSKHTNEFTPDLICIKKGKEQSTYICTLHNMRSTNRQ